MSIHACQAVCLRIGPARLRGRHRQRRQSGVLDKMKKRIDYDLDYLRNWSLRLDLYIVAKTVLVVLRDKHAY